MGCYMSSFSLHGSHYCQILLSVVWLCSSVGALSRKMEFQSQSNLVKKLVIPGSPNGLFGPIEVSPTVVPQNPYPLGPQSPMYPSIPNTYKPELTGRCPANFSDIASIVDKTASDCSGPLAALAGNVICCPQVNSLLHIFQGSFNYSSSLLVFQNTSAEYCFSDLINVLASRGANNTISALCSVTSANITGGSCPVKDIEIFEKNVNTSRLIDACSMVDPLKECCRPTCQPAITEAALHLSLLESSAFDNFGIPGISPAVRALGDCKGVVYAWLSRRLSHDSANAAFRILSSCKVNKACPLDFKNPNAVIEACRKVASQNSSCCDAVQNYMNGIEKQMLITNRQAINCATQFGLMIQKGGVTKNIYELCGIDLKDFSLQAYGQQGCLLRSLPTDVIFDNSSGLSFTCDLSDNIAAPWPSSSTPSLSLCAPEMSLPALPVAQSNDNSGNLRSHFGTVLQLFLYLIFHALPNVWLVAS